MTQSEDYLAHYGVKGMKWGVRRARDSMRTRTDNFKTRHAQKKAYKAIQKSRKQNLYDDLANMSDDELQNRINRVNMEARYRDALASPTYKNGKRIANDAIYESGKEYGKKMVRNVPVADVAKVAGSVARASSRVML